MTLIEAGSIMTAVSFATFVGILLWTYAFRRSSDFDAAALLPFADEEGKEAHHG
jgi:cytochrome c oxidase cbb3-type subunit 4